MLYLASGSVECVRRVCLIICKTYMPSSFQCGEYKVSLQLTSIIKLKHKKIAMQTDYLWIHFFCLVSPRLNNRSYPAHLIGVAYDNQLDIQTHLTRSDLIRGPMILTALGFWRLLIKVLSPAKVCHWKQLLLHERHAYFYKHKVQILSKFPGPLQQYHHGICCILWEGTVKQASPR